jgi:uncharacterized protein
MSRTVIARWKDWSGEGLEHLILRERPDGITVESLVLTPPEDTALATRYRIVCDPEWRVRRLEVSLLGESTRVELLSDGAGRWTDHAGAPLPELDGAIDVDLSATPFTNTLPIRRLALETGQAETLRVVYVRFPELEVAINRQRYTCLEPRRRYRYESVDSDFTREIEVDSDGLVVTYPGLFRRVL